MTGQNVRDGLVLAWKPPGMGSAALVTILKKKTGQKAGHTGTLDRFAEGLMILLAGRATALADSLLKLDKTYEATLRLGRSTDTLDPHGQIREDWPAERVRAFLEDRLDSIALAIQTTQEQKEQIPPEYSAIKQGGVRLSDLARRGMATELRPRTIRIHEARCIEILPDQGLVRAFFSVSSGTYIRSIARDLGLALGIPSSLQGLKRLSVGRFNREDSNLWQDPDHTEPRLIRLTDAFPAWPRISVPPDVERQVRNGVRLPVPAGISPGQDCFIVSGTQELLAWAVCGADSLTYRKVFG